MSPVGDYRTRGVDRYRVVGHPIAHSRSPEIHAAFARQSGQTILYERVPIAPEPPEAFDAAIRAFAAEGGRGVNVTLPFKERAFALADQCSERARAAGAVNTLILDGGRITGDNTDGAGIVADLQGRLGFSLAGRSVTLLGAGGATRGIVLSLLDAGASSLTIANRTAARAETLADHFNAFNGPRGATVSVAATTLSAAPSADLVINVTSAGVIGGGLALPPGLFDGCALAYDCVYSAEPTGFMQQALSRGVAIVSDGLGMLVEQAAESFWLWRAFRPETSPVYLQLRAALAADAHR